jgi:hypothetical protein
VGIDAGVAHRGDARAQLAAGCYNQRVERESARSIAGERPRRLRLDALLRELGADDSGTPPADRRAGVTIGELVDKAGEATFGFSVGVLGLLAIPFFGLSTPFGLAIALIGIQLAIGRARPWLPQRMRRRMLSMSMLDRILRLQAKRLRWLAGSTRRRWDALVTPRLIGLGIMLMAIGLALPLPIPGSNLIFIIPILIYAIALLEGDGKWSAVGHACTLVNLGLTIAFGATIVAVLTRVWHWIT